MPLFIRTWIANWRFRQMTAAFDRKIAEARKAHAPVRHIQRAKAEFVHAALRGESA